jgi:exosortase
LPHRVNDFMAFRLQQLATVGSCSILQAIGLPVLSEGNVIIIRTHRLEVAQACSGLRMLLSFLTLITAAAILVRRPLWDRIILLLSAIPIALVSNILRITTTGLCYNLWGTDEVTVPLLNYKLPHDWAGYYLMMPIGLLLVWLELTLLSWLVVEDQERVALPTVGTAAPSVYRAATARKEVPVEKEEGVDP